MIMNSLGSKVQCLICHSWFSEPSNRRHHIVNVHGVSRKSATSSRKLRGGKKQCQVVLEPLSEEATESNGMEINIDVDTSTKAPLDVDKDHRPTAPTLIPDKKVEELEDLIPDKKVEELEEIAHILLAFKAKARVEAQSKATGHSSPSAFETPQVGTITKEHCKGKGERKKKERKSDVVNNLSFSPLPSYLIVPSQSHGRAVSVSGSAVVPDVVVGTYSSHLTVSPPLPSIISHPPPPFCGTYNRLPLPLPTAAGVAPHGHSEPSLSPYATFGPPPSPFRSHLVSPCHPASSSSSSPTLHPFHSFTSMKNM